VKNASITFGVREGSLDMLVTYDGGFDEDNPAHLAAKLLSMKMPDLADPLTEATPLNREQVRAIRREQRRHPDH